MALTQSARLPGPSWDETIVPALRKRLESESQTLARRISAISVSSVEEGPSPNLSATTDSTIRERLSPSTTYSLQSNQGSSSAPLRPGFQQPSRVSSDRNTPSSRVNGNGSSSSSSKPSSAPPFKRSRTYSQPFASDAPPVPNAKINGSSYPTTNGTNINYSLPTSDSLASRSSLSEIKPTRIPKVARGRSGSNSGHGHPPLPTNLNGHNRNYSAYNTPPTPDTSHFPEPGAIQEPSYRNSTASHSTVSVPSRRHSGILNEQPPFALGSIPSSAAQSQHGHSQSNHSQGQDEYESPRRRSNESEERPFEHWYRGEVSRNGGVGELRVGKRLEMLDIANYGHTLKTKVFDSRIPAPRVVGEGRRRRQRVGSASGIDTRELDRGSLYLDEDRAKEVGRVLDEGPLTDLDGEGEWSDIGSSEHYSLQRNFNYMGTGDASIASAPRQAYNRSTTPTPTTSHTPSSRQQNIPPTRIPGPAPRQSSEPPRMPTPTLMHRGASEPPLSFPSSSSTPPSPSRHQRSQAQPQKQHSKSTPPHTPSISKRPTPPPSAPTSAKKSRTTASKATRAKTLATRKQMEKEANRRSVAHYPTPGEDMMDAIPSWTQPVPVEGNWDEVVLPVVARKKGLDGHYEQANGSTQARKVENIVEPAPGTFAFNHSKYRPPHGDDEEIPMDEFGRHTEQNDYSNGRPTQTSHDEARLSPQYPPSSPGPMSHYSPPDGKPKVQEVKLTKPPLDLERAKNEDEDGGCCKCVVM